MYRRIRMGLFAIAMTMLFAASSKAGIIFDFEVGGSSTVTATVSTSITVDMFITVTGSEIVSGYQFTILYDDVSGLNTIVNAPTVATALPALRSPPRR